MEPTERPIIDDSDILRESGVERNDVYHIINTCREHKKDLKPEQAAVFLARIKEEQNRNLFLSDCGPFLRNFNAEGMKAMVAACRHNKSKSAVVTNLAKFLKEGVTDQEKEEICALISTNFDRKKAKGALGISD